MNPNQTVINIEYKPPSNKARIGIFSLIHMVLAVIVIAWMNNGIFTYAIPYVPNFIRWGSFMAWFGLALIFNKKFRKTFLIQCWPILFFYFYMLLISISTEKYVDVHDKIMTTSYIIMVYSIFLFYIKGEYRRLRKVLVLFLTFDCLYVAINTYIELQINPSLARILSTSPEHAESVYGVVVDSAVGSYAYFYAFVSITLLIGFLFLKYRKRKIIILILILLFASIALLIKASFTLSIMFTFIFLALLVILSYTNKYTVVAIALLGVMTLLMFQGMFASMFSQMAVIEGIPSSVSERFNELAQFFSGNDISGTDINIRLKLYAESINAFVNNFLTGTVTNNDMTIYGGHSSWLDLLKEFGLLSIPFFVFLYKAYKYCKNIVPKNCRPFVDVYWLYFICLGFINTLLFANIFTIWLLFLPMVISSLFETSEMSTDIAQPEEYQL